MCGGTYFFTVTLRDRRSDLLVRHVDALRASWRDARARVAHDVLAAAVMPDHLHAVTHMHDGADDYPRLWQEIKKGFSRRLSHAGPRHGRRASGSTRSATRRTCARTWITCTSTR